MPLRILVGVAVAVPWLGVPWPVRVSVAVPLQAVPESVVSAIGSLSGRRLPARKVSQTI